MSTVVTSLRDAENQRQQALAQLQSEAGQPFQDEFRPGTFGCHELLDRTRLIADHIEKALLSHPACLQNQEWHQLAFEAAAALHDLYQRIGTAHFATADPTGPTE
jgi:hypothetical protein